MPDYRITTRGNTRPGLLALAEDLRIFMVHAADHVAVLSNPRFVSGYFVVTVNVTLPPQMLAHLNMELAP